MNRENEPLIGKNTPPKYPGIIRQLAELPLVKRIRSIFTEAAERQSALKEITEQVAALSPIKSKYTAKWKGETYEFEHGGKTSGANSNFQVWFDTYAPKAPVCIDCNKLIFPGEAVGFYEHTRVIPGDVVGSYYFRKCEAQGWPKERIVIPGRERPDKNANLVLPNQTADKSARIIVPNENSIPQRKQKIVTLTEKGSLFELSLPFGVSRNEVKKRQQELLNSGHHQPTWLTLSRPPQLDIKEGFSHLKWDCCPSGGFYVGHINNNGELDPIYPEGRSAAAECMETGKAIITNFS
jgi:hypothetical protein